MRIPNPPSAKDLMATARSFGNYDLAAAFADLIDNSIMAKATLVKIDFQPIENDLIVRVRDNGEGMSRGTLISAMRPASSNPEDERAPDDLGRFGWGLKSASLSQARILTVVSWRENEIHAAKWDMDDIDDWSMEMFSGIEASERLDALQDTPTGTEVIWSNCDRIRDVDDVSSSEDLMTNAIAQANRQLSLVFHRYLSGEANQSLTLLINGTRLEPIDPFMAGHPATQTLDADQIEMTNGSRILIQPYVLPHFSKLTMREQEKLGGPEGMVRNQGFYVYRNRRLIISGTWFRLIPHGELTQLTRVKVDLPNSADAAWRITVDKSDAQLPTALKRRLREIVKQFSRKSVRAHRKKGVVIDAPALASVWMRTIRYGQVRYQINREHPMVSEILDMSDSTLGVEEVLKLLESYFPADNFVKDASNIEKDVTQGPTSSEEFHSLIRQCMLNYMRNDTAPVTVEGFLEFLRGMEPFSSQWKHTESYVRENFPRE